LPRTFPLLTFNLAIAYPCLTSEADPGSPVFQASLEAAVVLGASVPPRLRMVDPARFESPWERPEDLPSTALGLAQLARESARQGVRLFVENSGQPIRSMALLVREARGMLAPAEAPYLGLCVDVCNSLRCDPGSDPVAELESLPPDYLTMVHFKQTVGGRPYPRIDEGDLDFRRQLRVLADKGYDGPAVLEIPPGEAVFDNFRQSVEYLESLIAAG
jgi:sugar phosphate isomerase/epimerase